MNKESIQSGGSTTGRAAIGRAAIGIDLGGTQIKGVLIEIASGEVLASEIVETKDGRPDRWKREVAEMEQRLRARSGEGAVATGLAAPGLVAENAASIAHMPGRMSGLEGFDWSEFLGRPVTVINDAHAALVAEVRYGSAKGMENVAMLTLGTGVGGALWINGSLYRGHFNRAGHLGHISLHADSRDLDITRTPGSLENEIGNATVSGRTFGRYADTESLLRGYREGDPIAAWAWLNSIRSLAAGIASLINTFSPETIVVGGGMVRAGESLFEPLDRFLEVYEWRPSANAVPIRKAHFDEWSGAIGAAGWLM